MKLLYKKIGFTLAFTKTPNFTMPAAFVLRSVIGSNLRQMCCIAHETKPFIKTDALTMYLIFIGSSISSLPYFYAALKKSGEAGILKERVPFVIRDVFSGDKSLLINNEKINTVFEPDIWEYNIEDNNTVCEDLPVKILSPLRFKTEGHYSTQFSAGDFANCLHRRTQTLCSQYGNNDAS
jgi:hypothetical protein